MISKELLSEVMRQPESWIKNIKISGTDVMWVSQETVTGINIYELMHICKMWGTTKNCRIFSEVKYSKYTEGSRVEMVVYKGKDQVFIEDTEPEAVFKACEWILIKTKEKK